MQITNLKQQLPKNANKMKPRKQRISPDLKLPRKRSSFSLTLSPSFIHHFPFSQALQGNPTERVKKKKKGQQQWGVLHWALPSIPNLGR